MAEEVLWCRAEEAGGRVTRVNVMHPSGEILLSYPPEHFAAEILRRIRAGQVRARITRDGGGETTLRLEDESGRHLHGEPADLASTAEPRDGAER